MDHDQPEQPICYDEKGRCTRDTNGDGDCLICASQYWRERRAEALLKEVRARVSVEPFEQRFC